MTLLRHMTSFDRQFCKIVCCPLPSSQRQMFCVNRPLYANQRGRLITARKRSLGQCNIFAPVCHSVHRGGRPGQVHPRTRYAPPGPGTHPPKTRYTPPGPGTPPRAVHAGRYGQQGGGTHPTGMHSFLLRITRNMKEYLQFYVRLYSELLVFFPDHSKTVFLTSMSKVVGSSTGAEDLEKLIHDLGKKWETNDKQNLEHLFYLLKPL